MYSNSSISKKNLEFHAKFYSKPYNLLVIVYDSKDLDNLDLFTLSRTVALVLIIAETKRPKKRKRNVHLGGRGEERPMRKRNVNSGACARLEDIASVRPPSES